jgi:hypothetical protein
MANANVDLMTANGQYQGAVAGLIGQNGRMDAGNMKPFIHQDPNTGQLGAYKTVYVGGDPKSPSSYSSQPVNNATLRRDEWKYLDEAVLSIAEKRLGGVQDLINSGLTYNIGNGMGSTVLEWHDVSDSMNADVTMDGRTRSQNDRPSFNANYLPLPIIHVDYEINQRALAASRNMGNPIDTTAAERASRKVREKLESMLFTDTSYSFGGGVINSYINHPDRNQVTLGTDWGASGKLPSDILADVISMKQSSIEAHYYGPWNLYIPTGYETILDEDYDTSGKSTQTIRQRIEAIDGIGKIQAVDTLPSGNVVLVQMTSDVVRLVRGMGVQNVEWQVEGNLVSRFKVMTIQVPQIRSDQDGLSGIVHLA